MENAGRKHYGTNTSTLGPVRTRLQRCLFCHFLSSGVNGYIGNHATHFKSCAYDIKIRCHCHQVRIGPYVVKLVKSVSFDIQEYVSTHSHLATTMCFFCRHVWTDTLVTMRPISDDMLTTSKICVAVAKWERALRVKKKTLWHLKPKSQTRMIFAWCASVLLSIR